MGLTELSELIKLLPKVSNDNLLVGLNSFDDAGIYKITDDIALIQTVDIFTPIVDNPYDYGKISAANSLSDVYAMGGKPISALNIIGFSEKKISIETAAKILSGAIDKTNEADCPIVGGHTIIDEDLKFGLSVTGIVHPDKIVTNSNAKAGDKLILTKPLGMGILSTTLRAGKLSDGIIKKITEIMSQLNKTAGETMVLFGANSATDITGFGLLGHAYKMAEASSVSIVLYADKIPYIPETAEMADKGFIPGGTIKNKKFLKTHVTFSDNISENERLIFFDAQTSGGLLISIAQDSADGLLKALHDKGIIDAAIIGDVTEKSLERIKIIR